MSLLLLLRNSGGANAYGVALDDIMGWWNETSVVTTTGALVDSVSDISGQNNTLVGTGALRPSLVTPIQNGLRGFDSVNKSLQATNTYNGVTAETIVMVLKIKNVAAVNEAIFGNVGGGSYKVELSNADVGKPARIIYSTASTTKGQGALTDVRDINSGSTDGKWKVLIGRRSQADNYIELWENGLLIGRDTHTSGSVNIRLDIGSNSTARAEIDWSECIHWQRAITDAEMAALNNALFTKWACPTANAAFNDYNDFVKRYAIAKGLTSTSGFLSSVTYFELIGDSTARGWDNKSNFTATYVKAFTDSYTYDLLGSAHTTTNWALLDSTNTASRNDQGNTQATMGINPVLAELLEQASTKDNYHVKHAVNGTKAADGWRADVAINYGAQLIQMQRYWQEAMTELVLENGFLVSDAGTVISLGPNDMDLLADYSVFEARYGALVDWCYNRAGRTGNRGLIYCCQTTSNTIGRATGLPIVQAATVAVANARSYAELIGAAINPATNTIDGTHNDAAWYESQAAEIITLMETVLPFEPSFLPGFVAYWDVREASTVTSSGGFIDSLAVVSGAARTLTATSTVRPGYVSTPPAYADFDGSNDVLAHTTRIFTAPAAMTIAFRAKIINPQPSTFAGRVFSEAGSSTGFSFAVGTGNTILFTWSGSTSLLVISNASAYNNTDYICGLMTYDGSNNASGVKLYINGVEVTYATQTNGVSLANSTGVTRIGQSNIASTNPEMDFQACVVCTGVLSGADIASLSTFLGASDLGDMYFTNDALADQYFTNDSYSDPLTWQDA